MRSYVRFNISGLPGAVTRAELRILAASTSTAGYDVRSISSGSWSESAVTYATAPVPGTLALGSSGPFAAGAWTVVDLTPYVTGDGTYDFVLSGPSTTQLALNSQEVLASAPQLRIETATGTATPSPTPTPTSTACRTARHATRPPTAC